DLDRLTIRYSVYVVVALIWAVEIARWAYRVMTFSYRLTNHRLLLERSFFNSARAAVELVDITSVRVDRTPVERLLGVGRLEIASQDPTSPKLVLPGLHDPDRAAERIRRAVDRARSVS